LAFWAARISELALPLGRMRLKPGLGMSRWRRMKEKRLGAAGGQRIRGREIAMDFRIST